MPGLHMIIMGHPRSSGSDKCVLSGQHILLEVSQGLVYVSGARRWHASVDRNNYTLSPVDMPQDTSSKSECWWWHFGLHLGQPCTLLLMTCLPSELLMLAVGKVLNLAA